MRFLHEIYGIGADVSGYRSYLKNRIVFTFPEYLYCLRIDNKTPEIMTSKKNIDNYTLFNNVDKTQAANLIREKVLTYAQTIPLLSWPPNIEELRRNSENIPEILKFYKRILAPLVKQQTDSIERLIHSFSSDMIHVISRGKVMTEKHFLLGLGIHNITGQKLPIKILHKLGHSIEYNKVCEIETARAELAIKLSQDYIDLPLRPGLPQDFVVTHFWAYKFEMNLDSNDGNDSIHSTHVILFQEVSDTSVFTDVVQNIPRSKTRSLSTAPVIPESIFVNTKPGPNIHFPE